MRTPFRRATTATICAAGLFLAACDGTDGPSTDPPVQPTDDGEVEDVEPMPQDDPDAEPEAEAEQPGGDADPDDDVDPDAGTDAGGVG